MGLTVYAALALMLTGCVEGENNLPEVPQHATADVMSGDLYVEIVGENITIRATDVTLADLLEAISRQTGMTVEAEDALNEPITTQIDRLHFPIALARILRQHNYTLQYVPPLGAERSKVWIFSNDAAPELSASAVGAVYVRTASGGLELEGTEDMKLLSTALTADDNLVRVQAVSALADVGGHEAEAALRAAALNDGDPSVRGEAVYALSETGGDTVIQVLQEALLDPDSEVQAAAVEALAEIGGDQSALALAYTLNSPDVRLRADAVDALAEIGSQTAINILEQALADQDDVVRETAAEYLAELSHR